MITDFEHGEHGTLLEADLCIVGAGPAGLALASTFDASQFRVVLLESGGLELETELNAGESVGLPYTGLQAGRGRAFGGTSKLWAGQCVRLDELDFQPRSWVPHSGWPITLAELKPFYARAEAFFEVDDLVCDENVWTMFGLQAPKLQPEKLRLKGTVYGPYIDAGQHTLKAFKASKNIQVLLHATTTNIVTDETVSVAEQVAFRSHTGKKGTVRAKATVLCCGGVENARLLLLADTQAKAGLGNQHGVVGRFLQEHPTARTATLSTATPQNVQRLFSLFYKNGRRFFPKLALSEQVQRTYNLLNGVAYPVCEYPTDSGIDALRDIYQTLKRRKVPEDLSKKLWRVAANIDQTTNAAYQRLVKGRSTTAVPEHIYLQLSLEQAPNRESRVLLAEARDLFGLRKARVDWRLSELERRTATRFTEIVAAELERLGLAHVQAETWLQQADETWVTHFNDVYHPAGTTRMSADPREGVVDKDCQVHGLAGLYLAGSSVFPTSGWAEPNFNHRRTLFTARLALESRGIGMKRYTSRLALNF